MNKEEREEIYGLVENSAVLVNLPHAVRSWAIDRGFETDVDSIIDTLGAAAHLDSLDSDEADRLIDYLETEFDISQLGKAQSELGEAVEAVRTGKNDDHLPDMDGVTAELADTIIRICHLHCRRQARGLATHSLGEAIALKMRYNETRPYKHGKKA